MKYPDSMLSSDEEVIFDVHHHLFVLWKPLAIFLVLLAGWVLVLSLLNSSGPVILAGLVVLFLILGYLVWRILVWSRTNLVLTDHRLIYQTGVLSRHSREIPLSKINDVSFFQMVLGRMFGSGDLVVESASESGTFAYFTVPGPERLKMQILEAIKAQHKAAPAVTPVDIQKEVAMAVGMNQPTTEIVHLPPERPPLYSEIVDQIERLDDLRERGVLSTEEFQEAKGALLNRLTGGKDVDS